MRIAAISDIHIRPSGIDDGLVQAIKQRVEEISPDVFVIAGDISGRIDVLEKCLSAIRAPHSTNLFVAGNHDVWFEEDNDISSLDKYSKVIGAVCRRSGFHHLSDEVYIQDGIAFVGSLGWYDYSFKREELGIPHESYVEKRWKGAYWRDYYNIDWTYTDMEVTDLFNSKLKYDLETVTKQVKTIVSVSHHLPFKALTLYKDRLPWDFFSAFMGAESTGEILLSDDRVLLSISGHSHIRKKIGINGLTALSVPLGYGRPPDGNYESLVNNAVASIEITNHTLHLHHFIEGDICEGLPYSF